MTEMQLQTILAALADQIEHLKTENAWLKFKNEELTAKLEAKENEKK